MGIVPCGDRKETGDAAVPGGLAGQPDGFARLLLELHENLEGDAGLEVLARRSGYSPFHFHRLFSASVGETPKEHVGRVRLERAAYLIAVTDMRILAIALDVGFASHETFSRAFRRRFGLSPRQYRSEAKRAQAERLVRDATFRGDGCLLSDVWFGVLQPALLLAVRRLGAYADVALPPFGEADGLWAPMASWAREAGVAYERTAWAICHDDPTLTPGASQRLDACLPAWGSALDCGPARLLEFAGGRYAGVEHRGSYDTVIQAYRHVADGVRRSDRYTLAAGPPVQIFRHIDRDPGRSRTEIYFPIVRR